MLTEKVTVSANVYAEATELRNTLIFELVDC